MIKARIMLSIIIGLAIVGGALAFKVKSLANVWCKQSNGVCEKVPYAWDIIGTPTTTNPCPDQTVFYTEGSCQTAFIETHHTVTSVDLQ